MPLLGEIYNHHLLNSPDIRGHLRYLNGLASTCSHVTEFGVRWGSAASALISGCMTYRGYDIVETPEARQLIDAAVAEGRDARLIIMSSLDAHDMENTDLLLIDSLHTHAQAAAELAMHHHRVSRYIVLHDTETFGTVGEDGGPGLWPAVGSFLLGHDNWRIAERFFHDHGLTVLERVGR